MSRKERNLDSGLVVVVFIISSLIITVFSFLLFVDYEWCPVLFKNNTVTGGERTGVKTKLILFLEVML